MFKRSAWFCTIALGLIPLGVWAQTSDLDRPPNEGLNRNVRILRTTNKAQLNRYVPVVYRFNNANPFNVMRFIRRPVQAEEGAAFTFVESDGTGGLVLLAIPEYQIPYMDQIMRAIDQPGLTTNDKTKRYYYPLKHRSAADVNFLRAMRIYATGNETILGDIEQNSIFWEDAPSGADSIRAYLEEKLDKPTAQATLNIKIYELDMSNHSRIGVDFVAWKNGPGAPLFAVGAFGEAGRVNFRSGGTSVLHGNPFDANGMAKLPLPKSDFTASGHNTAFRYETHSAFLDFLVVRGKARILNSGRVAVLSAHTATITAGDQLLYYPIQLFTLDLDADGQAQFENGTLKFATPADPSGVRFDAGEKPGFGIFEANIGRTVIGTTNRLEDGQVVPVETGFELNVTPIISENLIDVKVDGRLSDYNGFDDTGFPRINSRSFSTNVRLAEGDEIVIGGLVRESKVDGSNKAPILGSIPIIGYLIGQENNRRKKSEIIIALGLEKLDTFDSRSGISSYDQSIIDQAEGTSAIETPDPSWGFDQFLLDSEKSGYSAARPKFGSN